MEKIKKTEEQWRAELTPEQYRVLREKGTERPFTGEYDHVFEAGTYRCAGCGAELFSSDAKYDSGLRLAGLLRAGERGRDRRGDGHDLRDGAHRGDVRRVRRAPRPRVPRRAASDGHPLLHQFGSAETGGRVTKKATFGAGCFWGVEAAFRQLDGVTGTRVGYAGGQLENPTLRGRLLAQDRPRRGRRGDVRPGAGVVRRAARRLLAQAQSDAAQPAGLGHRRPVPLGRLRPRRGAARGGGALEGARAAALPQADRHADRARADLLRGRGLPPAVPREARPLELHARAGAHALDDRPPATRSRPLQRGLAPDGDARGRRPHGSRGARVAVSLGRGSGVQAGEPRPRRVAGLARLHRRRPRTRRRCGTRGAASTSARSTASATGISPTRTRRSRARTRRRAHAPRPRRTRSSRPRCRSRTKRTASTSPRISRRCSRGSCRQGDP